MTASNSQREGDDGRGREEKEEDREQEREGERKSLAGLQEESQEK